MRLPLAVSALHEMKQACAAELASRLHLPLHEHSDGARFLLICTDDRLELRDGDRPQSKGISADFSAIDLRTGSGNLSRKQPLPRAIGKDTRTVVDATAGLGDDAALLACMEYDVTAIERHPVVAALLEDGLRRAMENAALAHALNGRLRVLTADARAFLESVEQRFDACYIDPMFPPRRRASALPRKAMQVLRELVGDDSDAVELLAIARSRVPRVVVKRPDHAPPLAPGAAHSVATKLVRYDVYLNPTAGANHE